MMIDREKLKALMDGDETMVQKFLDIFKNQTPIQLNQLKHFIETESWEQASITAHGIKSQCKYLGLDEIAEQALVVERLTDTKEQLGLLPGLFMQLEEKLKPLLH